MVSGLEMVTALIENALAGRTVQHVKTPPQLSAEQRRRIWGENVRELDEGWLATFLCLVISHSH